MANRDPRHNGQFAAAFAFGYAARILDANLEWLVPSALTGSFGLIAGRNEPAADGQTRPLFDIVRLLASLADAPWSEASSSEPSKVLAISAKTAEGERLIVGNMTALVQRVSVDAWFDDDRQSMLTVDLPAYSVSEISQSERGEPLTKAIA